MFDGFLKSKFFTKSKSAVKLTKARIEIIKKKRNAMQKFLKNDVADLLKNGLDINAYGRAEGLLVEMNLSTCYDSVEQFCAQIANNLAVMSKQKECPEECREAVSSLMFAAARFADLPELRELRRIFTERYGNSLDCFVNKEFVEKLKSTHPTIDMKLQLMQDIATEVGLDWNRKATEQKLYNPPVVRQVSSKDTVDEEFQAYGKEKYKQENMKECTSPGWKREKVRGDDDRLREDDKPYHQSRNPEERIPFRDIQVDTTGRKGQENEPDSARNIPEEECDDRKAFYYKSIPPPYTKSKMGKTRTKDEEMELALDGLAERKDKQKPKSVRRRRTKPDDDETETGHGKNERKTIEDTDNDQQDEEERMIDRLLMHYSKKKSSYGSGKSGSVLKPSPQQPANSSGRASRRGSWDGPIRATSFPVEPASPSGTKKGHTRAASLQPDMFKGPVHPKLPEYDDFVARLAALREGN